MIGNYKLVRIFSYEEVDPERPGHKEPCMNICKRTVGGTGKRVVIPLQNLWQYWSSDSLGQKALEFAAVLFDNHFTKSDILAVGNCIDAGLDELFKMTPHEGMTQEEFEKTLAQHEVKMAINGKIIVDAT